MKLFRLVAVLAVVVLAATTFAQAPSPQDETKAAITPYLSFVGVTPCRLVDTREAGFPEGYGTPALAASASRTFVIPESVCGIPATAKAVSMNVTVVSPSAAGFLAIWPGEAADQPDPLVSSLNYVPGDVVPNAVVVPLNASGQVTVVSVATANVIFDVNGYFTDTPAAQVVNTPAGSVAATTVQAAINELDSEKAGRTGWGADYIIVSNATGALDTDTQLRWDDANDTLALHSGSLKVTGMGGRTYIGVPLSSLAPFAADVQLVTFATGVISLTQTSGTPGDRGFSFPVAIPTQLFGTRPRIYGVRVCYENAHATSFIYHTNVYSMREPGNQVLHVNDDTERTSTTDVCYTSSYTDGSLGGTLVEADSAANVYLPIHFGALHETVYINSIRLILDEE